MVVLHNYSDKQQIVEADERIAQLIFMPVVVGEMLEVDELGATDRGDGGFGSTGA